MMGKIKGSLTVLSVFLIFIVGIGMVQASENITLPLEDSAGDVIADESLSGGKYFEDVQSQIDNAKDGDEIILQGDVYTPLNKDVDTYNPIVINKSINVTGISDKTIFNAQGMDGIFFINSTNHVVFKNITFTGAISLSAVDIQNSNVDLIDCIFDSNQGSVGGALNIYADGKDTVLNIFNSTFKNNGAGMGAAGVGGAISLGHYDCSLTTNIINSYFFNNIAIRGGAIYVSGDVDGKSNLNIDNTTFQSNRLTFQDVDYIEVSGSDIGFWDENNYAVNISNSKFFDDFDEENDYALSLVLLCSENNFVNNTFSNTKLSFENTKATFKGCNFMNTIFNLFNDPFEDYSYEGSAATSENLDYDINNCSFLGSSIVVGKGIIKNSNFNHSLIYKNSKKDLRVENCNFTNQSKIRAYSNFEISNSKFDGNSTIELDSIRVEASLTKISAVSYNSGKKIIIKVMDVITGESIRDLKLKIQDIKSKRTFSITTDKTGRATFVLDSKLSVGRYNFEITSDDLKYSLTKIIQTIKVTKAKTILKAPKVTSKYKKSKYFKVTVKDKSTKKAVKNIKVKIKVGKKLFKVKTNSKGVAKINTKSLKVGTHKVIISSGNSNYVMSAKSKIVIKR